MLDVKETAKKCHAIARNHGWWDPAPEEGTSIALMHSELSEALEAMRVPLKLHVCDKCDGSGLKGTIETINGQFTILDEDCPKCNGNGIPPGGSRTAEELADVIIRIFDFCGYHNIDIERAIMEKMQYNITRSHRHGDKAF